MTCPIGGSNVLGAPTPGKRRFRWGRPERSEGGSPSLRSGRPIQDCSSLQTGITFGLFRLFSLLTSLLRRPEPPRRMSWWSRLLGDTSGGDLEASKRLDYLSEALTLERQGDPMTRP